MSQRIERTLAAFGQRLAQAGRAVPMMLAALSRYHGGTSQIVIAGEPGADDTRLLLEALRRRYLPGAVVVPVRSRHRDTLAAVLPWVGQMRAIDGRAAAYVCRDFVCRSPVTSPGDLAEVL
jgi:hypothetical protein